jgi:hypothetical protein
MVAFTAGSVLTAANLNTAFNSLTINSQSGTTYTTVLSDQGGLVTLNNASAVAVTVPTNASVAYATGTRIELLNIGAGTVTIAGAGGVTVNGTLTIPTNGRVTLIKTATNTWWSTAQDAAVSAGALTTISPTSIANSGGSASASGGAVTFTGVSSISLNGVFSATYDHYRLVLNAVGSTALDLRARLRASGTDNTANSYENAVYRTSANNTSATIFGALSTLSEIAKLDTTGQGFISLDVGFPFAAQLTRLTGTASVPISGIAIGNGLFIGNAFTATNSFDGISIIPSTGTITGTIRIFGYKNA